MDIKIRVILDLEILRFCEKVVSGITDKFGRDIAEGFLISPFFHGIVQSVNDAEESPVLVIDFPNMN